MLTTRLQLNRRDLLEFNSAVADFYREVVLAKHPNARWVSDQYFGRIVAGHLLLSLRFSRIDPAAESMAWWDAARRLYDSDAESAVGTEDLDGLPHWALR